MMIYKHYLIYFFNVFFRKRILSYFAKSNFIIYDEWFDEDLEKVKLDIKNKKKHLIIFRKLKRFSNK